jgi:hypothetical protein
MRFGAGRFAPREAALGALFRAAPLFALFGATRLLDERAAGFRAGDLEDFFTRRATMTSIR